SLKAVVPDGGTSGPIAVTTSDGTGTSASSFTVTLSITGFSPTSGPPGTEVTLTGIGFLKAYDAKFGNVPAGGQIDSDTQLRLIVPAGAADSKIYVTDGTHAVASPGVFGVAPAPAFFDHVVFVSHRDGNYEIYVERRNGELLTRLTNNSAVDASPTWSPD